MNVLIIEDEKIAANNLEKMLLQIDGNINVQNKIDSIEESVKWLNNNTVDLIFLDIHLADGLCFKIFEQTKIKTPIVFTTAYDQYAIKAFKVNSIDYLLKPIEIKELEKSLEKFNELNRAQNASSIDYASLIDILSKKNNYQERFIVRYAQKIKSIKTDDIAYFYVNNENVFLCTKGNNNYSIDYSLEKLENIINPKNFFRVNRQFIVNISSIENMYSLSKSRIKIELKPKSDNEIIVSYNRMSDFRKWLNN
ncbi:MAG: LytTR family DNA-binding domain-containing protein [Bacteroidales bacterium]|nr:LytTR family DNA-binding domain-containing protein [Bacteroidales bacterium]